MCEFFSEIRGYFKVHGSSDREVVEASHIQHAFHSPAPTISGFSRAGLDSQMWPGIMLSLEQVSLPSNKPVPSVKKRTLIKK